MVRHMTNRLQVAQINLTEIHGSIIRPGVRDLAQTYHDDALIVPEANDFLDLCVEVGKEMRPSSQDRVIAAMDRIDEIVDSTVRADKRSDWAPERVSVSSTQEQFADLGDVSVVSAVSKARFVLQGQEGKEPQIWDITPNKLLVVVGAGQLALAADLDKKKKQHDKAGPIVVISGKMKRF